MRIIFGLVSLLVVVGIMLMIFKTYDAPNIEAGQKAQGEAQQLSGHDENGAPAYKSYVGEEYDVGTHFKGVKIDSLTPGGAMEKAYGLQAGDIVTQIGGMDVTTLGDYNSAKGQLDQAYQSAAPLTVDRNGSTLTLQCKGPMGQLMP